MDILLIIYLDNGILKSIVNALKGKNENKSIFCMKLYWQLFTQISRAKRCNLFKKRGG